MLESGEAPRFWRERPKLNPEFAWLKKAYHYLVKSRQVGMSTYYIPFSAYNDYCEFFYIHNSDTRAFLLEVISAVDENLLSDEWERQRRQMESKK